MSMNLQQFLARIAIDPELLASYMENRDAVMSELGLAHEDQVALKSGKTEEVLARINRGWPGHQAPAHHTVSHSAIGEMFGPGSHVLGPTWLPGFAGPQTGAGASGTHAVYAPVVSLTIWPAYVMIPAAPPAHSPDDSNAAPSGHGKDDAPARKPEPGGRPPSTGPSH
jgi:hypothetical protein